MMEEANAGLVATNEELETSIRETALSKPLLEDYRAQIDDLESKVLEQASEVSWK